ncbi:hypothetical protein H5983_06025 [Faecalitalea cylindroides]|uniref:hypothetical protein n=1 Tax=Faecalitalea cylindroides TaxID=39483 RepID=UPI0019590D83|nr:hypothetical protein [Faecalitalea cylindroides]MBM6810620.1 hypothetical protein [Faecalitalea cylindroides]
MNYELKTKMEFRKPVVLGVDDIIVTLKVKKSKAYQIIQAVNKNAKRALMKGKCFTIDLEQYFNIKLDDYLLLN